MKRNHDVGYNKNRMKKTEAFKLQTLDDYKPFIGTATADRIYKKAEKLKNKQVTHVNSTYYGGGVAELLSSLTLLMSSTGIRNEWRTIQGSAEFFSVTKKIHNALQSGNIQLTKRKKEIYEEVIFENSVRNHLGQDFVIVHDPQPLPLINFYDKSGPWIWRCHVDMTNPDAELWQYLSRFIGKYDAAIFSIPEYKQPLEIPQVFFMPAINPFSPKNKELSRNEIDERLRHYDIPTDLPLIVQISRFDKWKDPKGTIKAFKLARKEIKARLILLGNIATDDPEGEEVYNSLADERSDDIYILSHQDSYLVNALQHKAEIIIQKSIREGFGLTVTEGMWKGKPVIGGKTGGICHQITHGVNGFLVSSVEEAATTMIMLMKNKHLREKVGKKAKETVRNHFLMSRLLENYIDLLSSFEVKYVLRRDNGIFPS